MATLLLGYVTRDGYVNITFVRLFVCVCVCLQNITNDFDEQILGPCL